MILSQRHITSLILIIHILNSLLVLLIFKKLSKNNLTALIISALFAVHPLHVESVAWISERKDMLYSLFYLSAILSYLYFRSGLNKKYEVYVYILFILSCLSKAPAVTLPLILVAIDFYYEKKFTIKQFKDKIPLFLLSIIFGIINISAQYKASFSGIELEVPQTNIFEKLLIACYNYWFYIYKAIIPYKLSAFYPYPQTEPGGLPVIFYLSPLIVAVLIFAVWLSKKYDNKIYFGFIFYTFTIFPVLQFVPVGRSISADRFAYIPIIGLLFIISLLISYIHINILKSKYYQRAFITIIFFVIIFFSYLSNSQSHIWQNSMSLYTDMLDKNPGNFIAYNNRGTIFLKAGDYQKAESDFMNALNYNSKYATAYNNMGLLMHNKSDYDNAIKYFSKAIELNNSYAEAYFNMGLSYFRKNETDKAIELYKKSLEIDNNFAIAYNNLGNAYVTKEQPNDAILNFQKAVEIDPNYSVAHYNLAVSYLKIGNNSLGINSMKTAARLGNSGAENFLKTNKISW